MGRGKVEQMSEYDPWFTHCPDCQGIGEWADGSMCRGCGGNGRIKVQTLCPVPSPMEPRRLRKLVPDLETLAEGIADFAAIAAWVAEQQCASVLLYKSGLFHGFPWQPGSRQVVRAVPQTTEQAAADRAASKD